jgi:ketosteroid isomerase-like protein
MDEATMHRVAEHTLQAWSRQDVEEVLACYTPDLVYLDPNTRGPIRGSEPMRHYLTSLFTQWDMNWRLKEAHLFGSGEGCAILWQATLKRVGADREVVINGMDLVMVRGELISRNEVYFDRSLLAPLMG